MTKRLWLPIYALTFAVACAVAPASVAHAGSIPTVIKIDPVGPIVAGQSFTVTGVFYRHVEGGNLGIPNRGVKLYVQPIANVNDVSGKPTLIANVFSNKDGRLKWVVHARLDSGLYRLYFLYQGSPMFRDSVATTELIVAKTPAGVQAITRSRAHARRGSTPAQLSVETPAIHIQAGQPATLTVRLTGRAQTPLANTNVYLHVPGATQQRTTNANGEAVFVIKKPLSPGNHIGRVWFPGNAVYQPIEALIPLTVLAPTQTALAFVQQGDKPIYVGDELAFNAQLTANDQPVINGFVRFYLNGKLRYGARTDGDGKAVLRLPRDMIAGSHVISATFRGANSLVGATGTLSMTLLPRPFEVRAVPPLPSVKIRIGDELIQTDQKGVARLLVKKIGLLPVIVLPYESPDPNVRAEFSRWSDGVFSATRMINVANDVVHQIGFEVSHPVLPKFVEESSGRAVNGKRLNNIVLVNSAGEAVALTEHGAQWLKANRIVRHDDALVASPVSYHLRNVTVDGVNVVNEGQQRFRVRPNARWKVKLQMHDLAVAARDALFGFPIGTGLRVTYPMGEFQDVALDSSGRMRMESLSRGSYTVTLQGAYAIRTPMPVALSRNQDVDLAVISYLDIGIVVSALAIVAMSVLLVGRMGVFARLRHLMFRQMPSA